MCVYCIQFCSWVQSSLAENSAKTFIWKLKTEMRSGIPESRRIHCHQEECPKIGWSTSYVAPNIGSKNIISKRWFASKCPVRLCNKYFLGHNSVNMGALLAVSADLERSVPPLEHWHLRCVLIIFTFVVKCNLLWQKTAHKLSIENEKPRWGLESQWAGESNGTR